MNGTESNLKPLTPGEKIWITDIKESGTVISKVSNRSYEIEADTGEIENI